MAAVILAVGLLLQEPPPERSTMLLVQDFMFGTPEESREARERLLQRGRGALPELITVRGACPDGAEQDALSDLIFEVKKKVASDGTARAALASLETESTVSEMMAKQREESEKPPDELDKRFPEELGEATVSDALDAWGAAKAPDILVDQSLPAELFRRKVDIALGANPRRVLDRLAMRLDLDYDFRHGVIFLTKPERLWSLPPAAPAPLTEDQVGRARELVGKLGAEAPDVRDGAEAELRKLGLPVLPVLEEGVKSADAETAARCAALVKELLVLAPESGQDSLYCRRQKRTEKEEAAFQQLSRAQVIFKLIGADLRSVLQLLFGSGKVRYRLDFPEGASRIHVEGISPEVTARVNSVVALDMLEALTRPLGLDVRIEEDTVVVYEREARRKR